MEDRRKHESQLYMVMSKLLSLGTHSIPGSNSLCRVSGFELGKRLHYCVGISKQFDRRVGRSKVRDGNQIVAENTMGDEFRGKRMIATQEEMVAARVPLGYRDQCAHLLIPLNKCRVKEYYLPWKCEDERHTYEKCEYELFMERVKKMEKIRKEAKLQQKQPIPLMPDHAHA